MHAGAARRLPRLRGGAALLDRPLRAVAGRFRALEHPHLRLAALRLRLGAGARRGEPARRRAALPDGAARAAAAAGRRALLARRDAARTRLRAPGLSRMDLAAARNRRADPRLPSRRGAPPRARGGFLRDERVLEPASTTKRLDANLKAMRKDLP